MNEMNAYSISVSRLENMLDTKKLKTLQSHRNVNTCSFLYNFACGNAIFKRIITLKDDSHLLQG